MKINNLRVSFLIIGAILVAAVAPTSGAANESEVRGTIDRVFQQLKSRDYNSLYDALPSSSRGRISRTRFTGALSRAQNM
ncbi:MAG: hypothetical protein ACRD8U_04205, partial [Pyrinomonadaceae bacterium]